MAYTKKTFNTWPAWCHQRGSRATTADTSTTGSAHRAHLASDRKVCIWGFVFVWGGTRARPWVSRRGASFQHAYFPPKCPYLPDLVFNDSLFQVQHRLDYLCHMALRCTAQSQRKSCLKFLELGASRNRRTYVIQSQLIVTRIVDEGYRCQQIPQSFELMNPSEQA